MIIFFPIGSSSGSTPVAGTFTAADYVKQALQELRVVGGVGDPTPEDSRDGLIKLNRIFDNMNADRKAAYAREFLTFPLTPGLAPHTIGVSDNNPTWAVATGRPARLLSASLVLNTVTPAVTAPINVQSADWYDALSVPDLTSDIPTDVYYKPSWPNGELFFYPVPTIAYQVTVQVPTLLPQVELTTLISLPPGYHDALVLTLAEDLQGMMGMQLHPDQKRGAKRARARIYGANDTGPLPLATRDSGMPGGGSGSFNYRDRSFN